MLYPCILYVALLINVSVCLVFCLFVNCLVKQFAIYLGVVSVLLLNVMEVFSVGGGAPSAPSAPSVGFVYVFVYRKLSLHLRV